MDDLLRSIGQSGSAAAQRAGRSAAILDSDSSEFSRMFEAAKLLTRGDAEQQGTTESTTTSDGGDTDPELADGDLANAVFADAPVLDKAGDETAKASAEFDLTSTPSGVDPSNAVGPSAAVAENSAEPEGSTEPTNMVTASPPPITTETERQSSVAEPQAEASRPHYRAAPLGAKDEATHETFVQSPAMGTPSSPVASDEPLPVSVGSGTEYQRQNTEQTVAETTRPKETAAGHSNPATPTLSGGSSRSTLPKTTEAVELPTSTTPAPQAGEDPLPVRITYSTTPTASSNGAPATAPAVPTSIAGPVNLIAPPATQPSVLEADLSTLIKDPSSDPMDLSVSRGETAPFRTTGWTMPSAIQPAFQAFPLYSTINVATGVEHGIVPDLVADMGLETLALQQASSASATTITPGQIVPAATNPATASLMAQQIAAALADPSREPGSPIELALDPPELGRVRMQVAEIAGVMTLTIHADRPETAELMRRHLDLLSQEFAEAGLDAPSVRISQDGDGQNTGPGHEADPHGQSNAEAEIMPETSVTPTRSADGGLDLRL